MPYVAVRERGLELCHSCPSDQSVCQVEIPEVGEALEVDEPRIGDSTPRQVEFLEVGEALEVRSPRGLTPASPPLLT